MESGRIRVDRPVSLAEAGGRQRRSKKQLPAPIPGTIEFPRCKASQEEEGGQGTWIISCLPISFFVSHSRGHDMGE